MIPEDDILLLENEGRRALESKDWDGCMKVSERFFEADPGCDIGYPYHLEACAYMAEGDHFAAAASWLYALDHLEDIPEIEDMCDSIERVLMDLIPRLEPPYLTAATAVTTLSIGSCTLLGRHPAWLCADIVRGIGSRSHADEESCIHDMDVALDIVAMAVLFIPDIRDHMTLIKVLRSSAENVCAPGAVLEGRDPGSLMGMLGVYESEWESITAGMDLDSMDAALEYWGTRGSKFLKIQSDMIQCVKSGGIHDPECDEEARRTVRRFIQRWLRIRK